jgi:hypothetical protein
MTEQKHTNRGFQITEIDVADYRGEKPRTLQVQESSLASERKVWLGQKNGPAHGEPGRRFHLNEDEARQVRDALTRFLGDERPPAPSAAAVLHEVVTRIDEARYVNEARYDEDTSSPWANTDVLELLAHLRQPYTEGGVTEALTPQPTPTAEPRMTCVDPRPHDAHEGDTGFGDEPDIDWVHWKCPGVILNAAEPPRIEDMAPGTTFVAQTSLSERTWHLFMVTEHVSYIDGSTIRLYRTPEDRAFVDSTIDPSTIRDVTPPEADR